MKTKKFMGSLLLGGALGLIAVPAWSQYGAGQSSPTPMTKEPQTPPGTAPKGSLRLSKQDIHEIQQALEQKGYKPGTSSSLDSKTRDAIRAFQKDNNLPVTGTIDQRTSEELGVQLHNSMNSNGSSTRMR